jgi:hypothetical protein
MDRGVKKGRIIGRRNVDQLGGASVSIGSGMPKVVGARAKLTRGFWRFPLEATMYMKKQALIGNSADLPEIVCL